MASKKLYRNTLGNISRRGALCKTYSTGPRRELSFRPIFTQYIVNTPGTSPDFYSLETLKKIIQKFSTFIEPLTQTLI